VCSIWDTGSDVSVVILKDDFSQMGRFVVRASRLALSRFLMISESLRETVLVRAFEIVKTIPNPVYYREAHELAPKEHIWEACLLCCLDGLRAWGLNDDAIAALKEESLREHELALTRKLRAEQ
jgi:hypothetical protein